MRTNSCSTNTNRAPTARCAVNNDEERAEERLTQRRSQDADANAAANADAAASLPTTVHDLHADAAGAKKPLARFTESGRATNDTRQGRRLLALRLRRVGRGHGFCRWFNTIDKIRLKHDGLEAARGFTAHESR